MSYVLIRHHVNDYATWKPIFDEHGSTRQTKGSQGGHLFRHASDPNEIVVLLEWDDADRARAFAESDDTRDTMQRAGVSGQPEIYYLEEIEPVAM